MLAQRGLMVLAEGTSAVCARERPWMRRSTATEERKTRREKRELAARGRSRPPWLQAARRWLERSVAAARKTGQRRCYAAVSECGRRPIAVAGWRRQRL
ncbi:hypothetical protein SESBI_27783 [Sesbania bispinosa]|nr:hypothetical protein SESBI_27783 [Sesbania bispinosa]